MTQLNEFEMFIWVYNDENNIDFFIDFFFLKCENSVKKTMY